MDFINQITATLQQSENPTLFFIVACVLVIMFLMFVRTILRTLTLLAIAGLVVFGAMYLTGHRVDTAQLSQITHKINSILPSSINIPTSSALNFFHSPEEISVLEQPGAIRIQPSSLSQSKTTQNTNQNRQQNNTSSNTSSSSSADSRDLITIIQEIVSELLPNK